MKPEHNELFGWVWITLGFLTGTILGMFFHREGWLGGYASFPRRMVRLGHISLVALGVLNVLFAITAGRAGLTGDWVRVASGGMVLGGVTMPLSCAVVAWRRSAHLVFILPVISLLAAGTILCVLLANRINS